jgi:Dna[CI] antecedent, DciA
MVAKKKNSSVNVADFLPSLVRRKGWEKQLDLHSIFPKWKELVNEDFAEHAVPLKIEREVLWLEVENSSWLQQLQYGKFELLADLNDSLRLGWFKDIKMVLPSRKEKLSFNPDEKGPSVKYTQPAPEKIASFQNQVECIEDEKCRDALFQFWYLANACKKSNE